MQEVLIVALVMTCIALIGVILLQRSEGGALGIGGGGGGLMTARGAGDALSRLTAILATLFMGISLLLALLGQAQTGDMSTIEQIEAEQAARDQAESDGEEIVLPGEDGADEADTPAPATLENPAQQGEAAEDAAITPPAE